MSLNHSPKIVTDGLVFYYDMTNTKKSWKGKPTTNFAFSRSARIDSSYSTYSATASGTWNQKHPDAIRVYNDAGSEISAYVNTGVTDWTNTYHAIWTLDPDLKRPVVTMRDFDGQWKAKSFGLGQTMTSMGLVAGNTYSISWLQWTDDIAKSANAGLYGLNTGGTNGFHDGLSNSIGTSYNTLTHTWQRVYATFTVSASWNMSASLTCYMYGQTIKRGTLQITDVQIETGTASGFTKEQTRSNTQAILDLVGGNTITASSLTYSSNGTFSFDGTNNFITTAVSGTTAGFTKEVFLRPTNISKDQMYFGNTSSTADYVRIVGSKAYLSISAGGQQVLTHSDTLVNNTTYHIVSTYDGARLRIYVNGNVTEGTVINQPLASWGITRIGRWTDGDQRSFVGDIYLARAYNRALTADEVLQNFNATRSRYGV
jgi:hypothetical protein